MHVRFASRIESDKALNYNLKVIASNVMVGVTRCVDENIVGKEYGTVAGSNTEPFKPKVRPLAQQSYNVAQHDTQVSPKSNVPQKSSGLVNKAMDLIFGWWSAVINKNFIFFGLLLETNFRFTFSIAT